MCGFYFIKTISLSRGNGSQPKNFLVKNLKQLGIVQLLSNIAINSDMAMLFKWASRTSISFFIFRGVEVGASQVMLFPSVLTYAFCLLCTHYLTMFTLPYYAYPTLLSTPYLTMLTLLYYAHLTLLCIPYLTMHTLPYYANLTLLCHVTLLCKPNFTMHTLPYYAHLTLLCIPYPIMHTLPYYAHFTLLCTPYLTVHTLPYFLQLPEYQIIAPLFRLCLQ